MSHIDSAPGKHQTSRNSSSLPVLQYFICTKKQFQARNVAFEIPTCALARCAVPYGIRQDSQADTFNRKEFGLVNKILALIEIRKGPDESASNSYRKKGDSVSFRVDVSPDYRTGCPKI